MAAPASGAVPHRVRAGWGDWPGHAGARAGLASFVASRRVVLSLNLCGRFSLKRDESHGRGSFYGLRLQACAIEPYLYPPRPHGRARGRDPPGLDRAAELGLACRGILLCRLLCSCNLRLVVHWGVLFILLGRTQTRNLISDQPHSHTAQSFTFCTEPLYRPALLSRIGNFGIS